MNSKLKVLVGFIAFFSFASSAYAEETTLEHTILRYPAIAKEGEIFELEFSIKNIGSTQAQIMGCGVWGSFGDVTRQNEPTIQGITFIASAPRGQYFEGAKSRWEISYGALGLEALRLTSNAAPTIPFEYMTLNPGETLSIVERAELSEDVIPGDRVRTAVTCNTGRQQSEDKYIDVIENYPFSDISDNAFKGYIYNLKQDNIINGFSDGTYRPNDSVTRAQMANYIVKAFGFTQDTSGTAFPDVTDMTDETNKNIQTLKNLGIIKGFTDGTYRPNNNLTRSELTKFVYASLEAKGKAVDPNRTENFADVDNSNVFRPYIAFLSTTEVNGEMIIRGYSDGLYHPDEQINRGAMAKIIDLARNY